MGRWSVPCQNSILVDCMVVTGVTGQTSKDVQGLCGCRAHFLRSSCRRPPDSDVFVGCWLRVVFLSVQRGDATVILGTTVIDLMGAA